MPQHLYVHVPFCPSICPFCDFHVLERRAGLVDAYLAAVERDAARLADRFGPLALETIYLGGGTPSYLREGELDRLVAIIRSSVGWAGTEATLEIHPSTVGAARLSQWADLGFTRLSLGVESTNDSVLQFLGRSHDAATALRALDALVADGRFAVSADVMTAIPGQDVAADLHTVAKAGPSHVSAYTLTIEPGTPFARAGVTVDAKAELAALHTASEVLGSYGLVRDEVSNHARPGNESRHNQAYWRSRYWLGLGPSAAAFEPPGPQDPAGTIAVRSTSQSFEQWVADADPERETLDATDFLTTAVLAGLRLLREGADLGAISAVAGLNAQAVLADRVEGLVAAGLLDRVENHVRATAAGIVVLDQVAEALL